MAHSSEKRSARRYIYKLPMKGQSYSGIIRWGKRYQSANAGANGLYKYGIEFSAQNE